MLRKLSAAVYDTLFNANGTANQSLPGRQLPAMNAINQPQHYFGAGDPSIASPTLPKVLVGGQKYGQAPNAAKSSGAMTANPFGSGAQTLKPTTANPHGSKKLLGSVSRAVKNPAGSVNKMVRTKAKGTPFSVNPLKLWMRGRFRI